MQHLKEIVLPNYPLVLSLLKHRNVWVFWNKKKKNIYIYIVLLNYPLGLPLLNIGMCGYFGTKKKSGSNRCNPLNSSIDKFYYNKATPHVVDHPRVSISDTIFVIPVLKLIQKCHVVLI